MTADGGGQEARRGAQDRQDFQDLGNSWSAACDRVPLSLPSFATAMLHREFQRPREDPGLFLFSSFSLAGARASRQLTKVAEGK